MQWLMYGYQPCTDCLKSDPAMVGNSTCAPVVSFERPNFTHSLHMEVLLCCASKRVAVTRNMHMTGFLFV